MAERFRPLLLLPLAALVLHNLEELDKLPAWIDAHAPAWVDRDLYRSDRLALAMNLLTAATAAGLIPAALGAGCRRDGLAAATVGAIASNGALHVAQLVRYRAYNPGLCTAVGLLLPASTTALGVLLGRAQGSPAGLAAAALSGAGISLPIIYLALAASRRLRR